MTGQVIDPAAKTSEDVEPPPATPAQRGRLMIHDRVVEKVAARAATEVDRATGAPRTVLGRTLGRATEDSAVRTSADVDGDLVTVKVSISVEWPTPVRDVAAEVRRRIVQRIEEIVGLQVVEVHIDVPTLLTRRTPPPPRVR